MWNLGFVLFCSYEDPLNQIVFLVSLESSRRGGMHHGLWLVPWCLVLWCKSSWILNDFFIENWIESNHSWNFRWNLECAFGVFVEKILMSTISWNLFGKIWIQNVMWERYWFFKWFHLNLFFTIIIYCVYLSCIVCLLSYCLFCFSYIIIFVSLHDRILN